MSEEDCQMADEPMQPTGIIYAVRDHAGIVRYVGQTRVSLIHRWRQHLRSTNSPSAPFSQWLRDQADRGVVPSVEEVERASVEELDAREWHWIQEHRSTIANVNGLSVERPAKDRMPPAVRRCIEGIAAAVDCVGLPPRGQLAIVSTPITVSAKNCLEALGIEPTAFKSLLREYAAVGGRVVEAGVGRLVFVDPFLAWLVTRSERRQAERQLEKDMNAAAAEGRPFQ